MSILLRQLPNFLTASRLVLTVAYLILLAWVDLPTHRGTAFSNADISRLDWAFILFLIAGLTDMIDGPLARRLKVTSQFGRTFDPMVDKIFIIGGVFLLAYMGRKITALAWWMVAVIIAREVFVTIIRHLSEARGREFAATWAGKLKMFLQSLMIGTIILYIARLQNFAWVGIFRDVIIWVAVIFTAVSALIYLPRMKFILKKGAFQPRTTPPATEKK